jgi:PKD repeat protein
MSDGQTSLKDRIVNIYTGGGGAGTAIAVVAVVAVVGIGLILLLKKKTPTETVWRPVLSETVSSGTIEPGVISAGWMPTLNHVINSQALATSVISAGWLPALTAVVNSPALLTSIISSGWLPSLVAIVNSPTVTPSAPVPSLWVAALWSIANSPSLSDTGGADYFIALFVSPEGGGSATKSPDKAFYALGEMVVFTAYPAANYQFDHWELPGGTNVSNPMTVYINGSGSITAVFSPLTPAPVASFNASAYSGQAPLWVSFQDTSSGNIQYWNWNFGDGTGSSDQNPMHSFDTPGTYQVTLLVRDFDGRTSSTSRTITVSQPPNPTGPQFPAPGIAGDGQYWWWLVFTDNSADWFTSEIYFSLVDEGYVFNQVYGPYPSGATG